MPAPGKIERLIARSKAGINREEMEKAFDSLVSQSEDQVFALRKAEKLKKLEEQARREGRPIVYIDKEEFLRIDPALIVAQEERYKCVMIPIEESELRRKKKETIPYTIPPIQEGSFNFKFPDSACCDIHIDEEISKDRYHDRTFPKGYAKRKKAKRRIQKQSRKRK